MELILGINYFTKFLQPELDRHSWKYIFKRSSNFTNPELIHWMAGLDPLFLFLPKTDNKP